jgi:hypothetical protein
MRAWNQKLKGIIRYDVCFVMCSLIVDKPPPPTVNNVYLNESYPSIFLSSYYVIIKVPPKQYQYT